MGFGACDLGGDQVIPSAIMQKPKLIINPKQVLEDLRSGLDDEGLMVKYNLNYRQLQRLFRKMISGGYTTPMELARRLCVTKSQVTEVLGSAKTIVEKLD
jgi:DNA-binding MarR family transcriptional regulator